MNAPGAKSRRYRQDGTALTDGFTVRLPVGVDGDARRIARVLGVTLGDFATQALAEAVSMAMADPDVRVAVQAMARLDARQEVASGDPPPPAPEAPAHAAVGEAPDAAGGGPGTVPGSGLGLAIAARYARLLGGTLELTESSSRGSTFTLTLPLGQPCRTEGDA